MKAQEIDQLVKKLEPYFHGYKAKENSLSNDSGMTLYFSSSWNNKTKIKGSGAKEVTLSAALLLSPLIKLQRISEEDFYLIIGRIFFLIRENNKKQKKRKSKKN